MTKDIQQILCSLCLLYKQSNITTSTTLLTKKVTEFLVISDCVFYYFHPTLKNCFHFCKQMNKLIN